MYKFWRHVLVNRAVDAWFVTLVAIRTRSTSPYAVIANMSVRHVYLFGLFEHMTEDGRDRHHIDDAILVRVVGSFVLEHLFVVDFHN